jgi:hypothetical protein
MAAWALLDLVFRVSLGTVAVPRYLGGLLPPNRPTVLETSYALPHIGPATRSRGGNQRRL